MGQKLIKVDAVSLVGHGPIMQDTRLMEMVDQRPVHPRRPRGTQGSDPLALPDSGVIPPRSVYYHYRNIRLCVAHAAEVCGHR